jgi:two-component system heavy metal sensor histidine kinase CusS
MFSRPTKPRSIASQLVLLFTPAAALLLLCGLGLLYWIVVRHAFEEDNAVLADKLAAVRADLQESGGPDALSEELRSSRGKERAAYFVRVIDPEGRAVAESPGMGRVLPPEVFPPATKSRKPPDIRASGKLFSLAATTAQVGGQAYTIQLAQDRSADDRFGKEFGALTIALLGVGVAGAALIAMTVARRGLRPLGEMTQAVERIGPTHFNERVSAAQWPRELQPLATAFDAMLERLEDSFRRLSQFSADLAHELRTPITNMLGEAQVALTKSRSADEYRAIVESSVAECERLAGIVDNLLFLARAESADHQVQRRSFNGRAAIDRIASYYRAAADERQIAIRCDGEGEVTADPQLFDRAATNLVDNALRFTPDGGKIELSIQNRGGHSELTVHDNGCGISADDLPRIFDRFYRGDRARSSAGTGLGLSLVKTIAELHGGTVVAKSEVNRGTTLIITFPNRPESAAS